MSPRPCKTRASSDKAALSCTGARRSWGDASSLACIDAVTPTADDDTVVWGTDDTVVWGTGADDTVVWGTLDEDTVVWGTSDIDDVLWGK